jgi:hypothetical protein
VGEDTVQSSILGVLSYYLASYYGTLSGINYEEGVKREWLGRVKTNWCRRSLATKATKRNRNRKIKERTTKTEERVFGKRKSPLSK